MKLKPVKKALPKPEQQTYEVAPKKTSTSKKNKQENSLPVDDYKPMFPPMRFLVRETHSHKNPTEVIKQYVELSVKRYNDDEALPFVWIQMYQESNFYTGYLKGKTVYLPLEMLYDLIDNLTGLSDECDKRKIE